MLCKGPVITMLFLIFMVISLRSDCLNLLVPYAWISCQFVDAIWISRRGKLHQHIINVLLYYRLNVSWIQIFTFLLLCQIRIQNGYSIHLALLLLFPVLFLAAIILCILNVLFDKSYDIFSTCTYLIFAMYFCLGIWATCHHW